MPVYCCLEIVTVHSLSFVAPSRVLCLCFSHKHMTPVSTVCNNRVYAIIARSIQDSIHGGRASEREEKEGKWREKQWGEAKRERCVEGKREQSKKTQNREMVVVRELLDSPLMILTWEGRCLSYLACSRLSQCGATCGSHPTCTWCTPSCSLTTPHGSVLLSWWPPACVLTWHTNSKLTSNSLSLHY